MKIWTSVSVVLVLALVAGYATYSYNLVPGLFDRPTVDQSFPAVTVSTATAELRSWEPFITAVGTLVAVNGVDVASQISGIVAEVTFISGQEIAAGGSLIRLDDDVERAEMKENQAVLRDANLELERARLLFERGNISQSTLTSAEARFDQAAAALERTQAVIAQKDVRAPFAGRLGVRLVNLGQFIAAGTPIVTLQALQPIFVNFRLPEQNLSAIRVGQEVEITVDAYRGDTFRGILSSYDSKIDWQTRMFLVQATFANKDRRLVPGMYAKMRISVGQAVARVSVPETAVTYSLYGDSVYLVKSPGGGGDIVERRSVTLGNRRNGWIAVLTGISEGDPVVATGQAKLRNGDRVAIDDSVALKPAGERSKY